MRADMENKKKRFHVRLSILLIITYILLASSSLVLVRNVLLDNIRMMGETLSKNYSLEEEKNTITYEALMNMSCRYIDQQMTQSEDTVLWIERFLHNITNLMAAGSFEPYVVIDGVIYTGNSQEADTAFHPDQSVWYQEAVEAQGEIVFTDLYTDEVTGTERITIAKAAETPNTVVAFDVFPENYEIRSDFFRLPEGSSYFLCDSSGRLVYAKTALQLTEEKLQDYASELIEKHTEGEIFLNPIGEKRISYLDVSSNGWISIITLPYSYLAKGMHTIINGYMIILLIILSLFIFIVWKEERMNRDLIKVDKTMRILINSYFAIYRMNFEKETYEIIKGSSYVSSRIPVKGPYQDLLRVVGEVIEPDAFKEFSQSFSADNIRTLKKGNVRNYGGDFRRLFDGEYRWVNIRLFFDEALHHTEALLCFREIEYEKKQELQRMELLKNSLEAARKSEASRNMFFSSMSHDMRTPLNAIIGAAELAKMHIKDTQKVQEYLEKMKYSGRVLLELINDILEISRMEQGKLSFDIQKIDLRQCLCECCDIFSAEAEANDKIFEIDMDLPDVQVYGDCFRISQIVNNLLSNAFKYTNRGDRILLSAKTLENQDSAKYLIVVEDTGIGMSEAFQEKIFLPYEREIRFGENQILGTGLGMSIVYYLVTQMGGTITVFSQEGKGSKFTVILPLAPAEDSGEKREEKEAEPEREYMKGRTVLVAEDNEINMEIITELLQEYGIVVCQARNGKEAADLFIHSNPFAFDAVLLDMQMPVMDGCQAAKEIRTSGRKDAEEIPIIAITANAFPEDLAATTAAGMDAHVEKPIDIQLLCKTIEDLIKRNRGNRDAIV